MKALVRIALVVMLSACASFVWACGSGGEESADSAAIEQELLDGMETPLALDGIKDPIIESVECPDDLALEPGAEFECTVSHQVEGLGETATVEVDTAEPQYAYFSIPILDDAPKGLAGQTDLSAQIGTSGDPD